MQSSWKDNIYQQREQLARNLREPFARLAEQCAPAWGQREGLNAVLLAGFESIPHCTYLYCVGTDGVQICDNVDANGLAPEYFGRDRSQRPYMQEAVPAWGFLLSDAYISLAKSRPSLTALQIVRAENGQPLNIIIGAGLKSSVFQGYLLISRENMSMFFPSVEGGSVFLIDGDPERSELYSSTLNERLSQYGFSSQNAGEKLASFFQVTNTYLNVFAVLGAFGMILGITGLGFVLLRNYNLRRREFAFLSATGFTESRIRKLILKDQMIILLWGVLTGTLSGLTATISSIMSGSEIPWKVILVMILSVFVIGSAVLYLSVRSISSKTLISQLRRE